MSTSLRWMPNEELSKAEEEVMARLTRTRKLFVFLRTHRHRLFDESFQSELEGMYRGTGAGLPPVAPALMAMAMLLQAYVGASDAETVELTVHDRRWQLVLDCLDARRPAFSQGAIVAFRNRLIASDMDRRLLERTIALAAETKAFDSKKLPKTLRVAIDSSPLEGAGRVEDTVNLLAHAAKKVVACAARLMEISPEIVARDAGAPLLIATSVKRGLDTEWSDKTAKAKALNTLIAQLDALVAWIDDTLPEEAQEPPLKDVLDTLARVRGQDLEPDPSGGGGSRVRKGVAPERLVSIEDPEMRHGRKSKSKRFNGYKRHIASDLDTRLILACAMTPANRPELEACSDIQRDLGLLPGRNVIGELHIDRGYIASPLVAEVLAARGDVVCKPWVPRNGSRYTKRQFHIDLRRMTITCPGDQSMPIVLGSTVKFDAETCGQCHLRAACTGAARSAGRSVSIASDEPLQLRLRKRIATPKGRARLRERTNVEHHLAHLSRRQGRRGRFVGTRKNLLDTRRAATIQNLETIQRLLAAAA